jgi:hypothetical protein
MYPIDAGDLVRRGTHGSHALDPTLPHRPSLRLRLKGALATMIGEPSGDDPRAPRTEEAAAARG